MRHKGVRPVGQLTTLESDIKRGHKMYHEALPDGGYRIWNDRLLKSGCGKTLDKIMRDGSLVYCPYCDEWSNEKQFE